ncbi:MAG: phosphonate ABC transporter substrate-binding protein [Candidatus Tokpelaia sp.]|nr:MAG: phosphonate ABC transporter substrate-binding protein [Candidatus Tokpelaia sp.]KAA6206065.1 MAG: phosphonate ABC transporter substrate-binding protein [Candidatus Tokpelaia sp.]
MHKIRYIIGIIIFGLGLPAGIDAALARNQVQIAGSSTVLPYARLVADAFSEAYPQYKIPVIESGGSGAGLKEFCKGVGENTIDIANSSRAIKAAELRACAAAGIDAIEEVRLGYDGVVLATGAGSSRWNITPQDIYKALAARLFIKGDLRSNPYKNWHEVNNALPAWEIIAYIPGEKHGTREVVEEKLLLQGCRDSGAYAQFGKAGFSAAAAKEACIAVRKDGRAVDIDGDYSETLARLTANPVGLGVFGLSFYQNNADRLQLVAINAVLPSEETIANGRYSVSRPLFMYVKKAHIGVIPGMREYIEFFLSEQMIGPESPLAEYGLVPQSPAQRAAGRAAIAAGQVMAIPRAAP